MVPSGGHLAKRSSRVRSTPVESDTDLIAVHRDGGRPHPRATCLVKDVCVVDGDVRLGSRPVGSMA